MTKPKRVFCIVLLCLVAYACRFERNEYEPSVYKDGSALWISGNVPKDVKEVIFEIRSERNHDMSYYHQIHPDFSDVTATNSHPDWNIFYPVVDVFPSSDLKAFVKFKNYQDSKYSINGMFFQEKFPINGHIIELNPDQLFHWENSLHLDSAVGPVEDFYVTGKAKVQNGEINHIIQLFTRQWSGTVTLYFESQGTKKVINHRIELEKKENSDIFHLASYKGKGLDQKRLLASLSASIQYNLNSRNTSSNDPVKGGLYLFYDLAAQTYRRPTWLWSWGPSIKMMLEATNYPEINHHFTRAQLYEVSTKIGETTLRFQNTIENHPARGIITSRWSESKNMQVYKHDYEEFYNIADALFLAAWGLIPIYKHTGDDRFLSAVEKMVLSTKRIMDQHEIIPMDYMQRHGQWKNHAIDEQGFGLEGINELYQLTKEKEIQEIGYRYMNMLLPKLEHESGLWNRAWIIDIAEFRQPAGNTRGQGWAMEGLLAFIELSQDDAYVNKAVKMAEVLMEFQLQNGAWSVNFTEKNEKDICEKATALWSHLFYRLFHVTHEERHLQAARRALNWCLEHQYDGDDVHAYGSIPWSSSTSGVIYRKGFPLACNYTTGFFGLAVMEELTLMQ